MKLWHCYLFKTESAKLDYGSQILENIIFREFSTFFGFSKITMHIELSIWFFKFEKLVQLVF